MRVNATRPLSVSLSIFVISSMSACTQVERVDPGSSVRPTHISTSPTPAPQPSETAGSIGEEVDAEVPDTPVSIPDSTRVLVLSSDADDHDQRQIIRKELMAYGRDSIEWRTIDKGSEYDAVSDAYNSEPDLLVIVGTQLLGSVDLLSASYLGQATVILGGQIAEPTENVSSVIWPGADGRAAIQGVQLPFRNAKTWARDAVAVGFDIYFDEKPSHVYRLG